ncbi:MAG: acyltransferase family protein [Salinivirgaceae bacterium]|nr:acyltransferase family protein [Salinivirgaceae bacterium]
MRNPSVSIAKGIAIILMVMAHARCGIWWQHYINMFHMPLFFFMSGYCFKETYLVDTKGFVTKKIKGIWWPFVKWQLIFLLLHNVFFALNIYNGEYGFRGEVSHAYGISETLKNAFYIVTTMSHGEQLLGGFWFLKSLFVGLLFFYFATKLTIYIGKKEEKYSLDFIVGGMLLAATLLFGFIGREIPFWGIGVREFMASFLIWSGYMYAKYEFKFDGRWWLIVAAALLVAVGTEFWQCSMLSLKFGLIVPYIITALLGSLMVFGISQCISVHDNWLERFLVFVGDNTLDILTWHFLSFKLLSLLLICLYGLPIERLAEFPVIEEFAYQGWWVLYLVVGVAVALGVSVVKMRVKQTYNNRLL